MTAGTQCDTCRTCPATLGPRRDGRPHGLCRNCYVRWAAAGYPDDGPPPPARPWGRVLAARLEDYAWVRSWGTSIEDAAPRIGVSVRTAERYEAMLLAAGKATWRRRDTQEEDNRAA